MKKLRHVRAIPPPQNKLSAERPWMQHIRKKKEAPVDLLLELSMTLMPQFKADVQLSRPWMSVDGRIRQVSRSPSLPRDDFTAARSTREYLFVGIRASLEQSQDKTQSPMADMDAFLIERWRKTDCHEREQHREGFAEEVSTGRTSCELQEAISSTFPVRQLEPCSTSRRFCQPVVPYDLFMVSSKVACWYTKFGWIYDMR